MSEVGEAERGMTVDRREKYVPGDPGPGCEAACSKCSQPESDTHRNNGVSFRIWLPRYLACVKSETLASGHLFT